MEGAGILDGDHILVDKSIEPASGHIVVVVLDGQMTLKRFTYQNRQYRLVAANLDYPEGARRY